MDFLKRKCQVVARATHYYSAYLQAVKFCGQYLPRFRHIQTEFMYTTKTFSDIVTQCLAHNSSEENPEGTFFRISRISNLSSYIFYRFRELEVECVAAENLLCNYHRMVFEINNNAKSIYDAAWNASSDADLVVINIPDFMWIYEQSHGEFLEHFFAHWNQPDLTTLILMFYNMIRAVRETAQIT